MRKVVIILVFEAEHCFMRVKKKHKKAGKLEISEQDRPGSGQKDRIKTRRKKNSGFS